MYGDPGSGGSLQERIRGWLTGATEGNNTVFYCRRQSPRMTGKGDQVFGRACHRQGFHKGHDPPRILFRAGIHRALHHWCSFAQSANAQAPQGCVANQATP